MIWNQFRTTRPSHYNLSSNVGSYRIICRVHKTFCLICIANGDTNQRFGGNSINKTCLTTTMLNSCQRRPKPVQECFHLNNFDLTYFHSAGLASSIRGLNFGKSIQPEDPEKGSLWKAIAWHLIPHLVLCCTSSQLKEELQPGCQLSLSPEKQTKIRDRTKSITWDWETYW